MFGRWWRRRETSRGKLWAAVVVDRDQLAVEDEAGWQLRQFG